MKLEVTREDVWAGTMEDQPGELATKLRALADAGVNLEFVIARRKDQASGKGVVFVTPVPGGQQAAAKKEGFSRAEGLHSVRVVANDEAGLGAKLAEHLAAAGINLRGFSGASLGDKAVLHFALDDEAMADKARDLLSEL